ncbi:sensor histidine kinase [Bacteriovorax sp. Seq25_V]|uniref:sensor histidine kinase n=1 Tax=Bacteriovorax sp. Seq25_V TaxID=1201288 RepID=UPI000389E9D2|nr:ATP-binding protein [Bacteriovorax sp. Seq25_V]EQC45482.1 GHKL domain protein [Bacteriovorax sp. Seq25_V]
MNIKNNISIFVISTFLGLFIGILITFILVFLDIQEMGMVVNFANILNIIKSQRIYTFALLTFPFGFTLINLLMLKTLVNSKQLKEQSEYISNVLNSMEDYIFSVNGKYDLLPQNHLDTVETKTFNEIIYNHNSYIDLVSGIKDHFELEFNSKIYIIHFSKSNNLVNNLGILSAKDITSLKDKQSQLEEKSKELEISSRMSALGEISAGIAHEINNPLAIIQGNISLIIAKFKRYGRVEENQLELCDDKISQNIERISNIIKNLKNLASKESSLSYSSVSDLISKSKPLINNITSNHGINYNIDYQIDPSTMVSFNPVEFTQIMFNLFSNSKDAMDDFKSNRWIKLVIEDIHDSVIFKVIDSGKGIDKEIATNIFTPMFTTKDFGKGSGLGLSLSGMLAKKNEASIAYDMNAENTTFVIKAKKVLTNHQYKKAA